MKMYRCFALAICFILSGCIGLMSSSKDVTDDQRYWGGYKPGMEVLLVEDVYILKKNNILLPETYFNSASSPNNFDFVYPNSFNEYLKAPEKYPELKILKKGVVVKCTKIYFVDSVNWGTINIYGVVENGDYKNYIVSLRFLSDAANPNEGGLHRLKPYERYLKPVEKKNDDN